MGLMKIRSDGARLAAFGLTGLLLVGCAEDDGVDHAGSLAQAQAVCDEVAPEFQEVMGQIDGKPSPAQVQRLAGDLAPIMRRTHDRVKDLSAPADQADDYESFLAAYATDTEVTEEAAEDEQAAEEMSEEPPFEDLTRQARALSLEGCVPSLDTPMAEDGQIGQGLRQVEVTATEYEYGDIPAQAFPGNYEITLVNEGQESHELSIVKLKEGTTAQSVIEAQEAGEDPATLVEDFLGSTGAVEPGGSGKVTVTLEDGATYGYACLIEAPDGKSHAAHGMVGELEITTTAG